MVIVVTCTLRGHPRIMQAVRTVRGWDGGILALLSSQRVQNNTRDGTDPADLPGLTRTSLQIAAPLQRDYSAVLLPPQVQVLSHSAFREGIILLSLMWLRNSWHTEAELQLESRATLHS